MKQPEFGNKLVEVRKSRGLTQLELSEKCDVSFRTIQRIEAGNVVPRGFTIKTLSAALDFDFLKEFREVSSTNTQSGSSRFILGYQIVKQTIDLFNLKTNAMKKLSILTVIFSFIGFGVFFISNNGVAQNTPGLKNFLSIEVNETITQKQAIIIIDDIQSKAGYHSKPIDLLRTYTEKSEYNFDTYVMICKLIGSFGHTTLPPMEIAHVAFFSNSDCDLFNEIAPLIFLNTEEHHETFIKLAKRASRARTENEKEEIKKEIEKYKAQAKYKSLDEAFNNQ